VSRRLRFRGESRHKVDSKGRVSIPSDFRRVLEAGDPDWTAGHNPSFVMVYGNPNNPFIECFTVEEIERIEDQIDQMEHDEDREMLEDIYSSNAINAQVDDTGRIVVPAKLRAQFGIGNEAVLAAALNQFRIWDAKAYDAQKQARVEERKEALPRNPLQLLNKGRA
jgi:MraZ protein